MNKVILRGNLGNSPELRYTGSQVAVCNFRLATNERYTDKEGNKKEITEWHRITVWGKLAEVCAQYLNTGREVLLEGKLRTRQWDDNEGVKRYTTEIVASGVEFLSGGRKTEANQGVSEGVVPEATVDPVADTEAQRVFNTDGADTDVPF